MRLGLQKKRLQARWWQQALLQSSQIRLLPFQHNHQRCLQHCQQWLQDSLESLQESIVLLFQRGLLQHLQL